jgi:hypothetical protein
MYRESFLRRKHPSGSGERDIVFLGYSVELKAGFFWHPQSGKAAVSRLLAGLCLKRTFCHLFPYGRALAGLKRFTLIWSLCRRA